MVFYLHWLCRNRTWQNLILVFASYFFYGWWDYRFCSLMLFSSLVDYGLGIFVFRTEKQSYRRLGLILSLFCNLGLLCFFKYFNFFSESLVSALGNLGWTVHPILAEILLPVGISFYTFQTLSYTIDIYRNKLSPTTNLIDYLAFVSFFPQLVAGPIERATNLIPQFSRFREFSYTQAVDGCRYILWGFIKKLVIADRLARIVDIAYDNPADASGIVLILATIFFAFQIYCDFSAYSDIAIGTAKLFNIRLMRNFDYPYFSTSVTEFWRRWHISLSTWFRDYVFIPLGGSRGSTSRTNLNLMITFVLSGLWHGAAWRFVFWGAINGIALITEKSLMLKYDFRLQQKRVENDQQQSNKWLKFSSQSVSGSRLYQIALPPLKMFYTFIVICTGWVFFRAASINEAFLILNKMCLAFVTELNFLSLNSVFEIHSKMDSAICILIGFVLLEWFQRQNVHPLNLSHCSKPLRWATYTLLIWGTFNFMLTEKTNPFIYFAF